MYKYANRPNNTYNINPYDKLLYSVKINIRSMFFVSLTSYNAQESKRQKLTFLDA